MNCQCCGIEISATQYNFSTLCGLCDTGLCQQPKAYHSLQKEVGELEEVIKTGKCKHVAQDVLADGCSLCHLAWCEGRIKVLDKKCEEKDKELSEIKETYKNIIEEKCSGDEQHCTCVPALRKRIEELEKELKIQYGFVSDYQRIATEKNDNSNPSRKI